MSSSIRFGSVSAAGRVSASAVAATLGALLQPPVLAADNADAPASLEEVVVTALKRQESMQDVPLAVEALSGDMLARTGMVSVADYARLATNVNVIPNGTGLKSGSTMNMRGISPLTGSPTVAFYIDETEVGGHYRAGGVDPRLYDIERVEVLKGPQGHLYGSSAMGGVFKVVTRKPEFDVFEAGFDATLSSTYRGGENFYVDGVVNIPLVTDKAALRIVVGTASESGFVDLVSPFAYGAVTTPVPIPDVIVPTEEDVNETKVTTVRATLRYQPTDWLTLTPVVYHQRSTADGVAGVHPDAYPNLDDPRAAPYVLQGVTSTFTLSSLNIEADAGFGTFTSNTAYFDALGDSSDDLTILATTSTGVGMPTLDMAARISPMYNRSVVSEFTQELRFASDWDFPVGAVLGAYYEKRNNDSRQKMFVKEGGAELLNMTSDLLFVKTQPEYTSEKAVFGNFTYKFASRYEVQFGGRISERDALRRRFGDGALNGGVTSTRFTHSESSTTLSMSMAAHLTDEHMLYARVAEGYRPGSRGSGPPVIVCGESASAGVVRSDTTTNYELGGKTRWADGRVQWNATVFQIDYTDVQQAVLLPCGYTVVSNAGSATSKGFESELIARLMDGALDLRFGLGYVDSTLDEPSPPVGADLGEPLVNVPQWTANLSAEYRRTLPWGGYEGYVRGDYRYIDERTGDFGRANAPPTPRLVAAAYDLTDIRIGLDTSGWGFSLFISNLFDERAQLGYENLGPRVMYINRPRTFGFSVHKEL